jgi:hypothetical protein
MTRTALFAFILVAPGCASYYTTAGHGAATGAVGALTSDDSKAKLGGLAVSVVGAMRDEALGPTTASKLDALVTDTGAAMRTEVAGLITPALQSKLQETVRLTMDEALNGRTLKEVDALREELIGPPLQADVDALIASAAPKLAGAVTDAVQASLAPLQTDVSKDAATWKPIATWLAIGSVVLLGCLIAAGVVLHGHRRDINVLLARQGVTRP